MSFWLFCRRKFLSAFLLVLLGVSIPAQTPTGLNAADRMSIFDKVWSKINDKYYDSKLNGIDWKAVRAKYQPLAQQTANDQDFYAVLKQMVNEMHDAHTRFLTPREALDYQKKQGTGLGMLLSQIDGQTIVLNVQQGSEAERAGVRSGMLVKTIGGQNVNDLLAEINQKIGGSSSDRARKILSNRRLLEGEPETQVPVGLTDENGRDLTVTLTRKTVGQEAKAASRMLDSGIGYISLNSFRGNAFEVFKTELEKIRGAKGLIIDLRYNGGGSILQVLKIAGLFEEKGASFGRMYNRSQKIVNISAVGDNKNIYAAPVVILLNAYSASGSELFAGGLQEAGRARVIGRQSCGCLLGISEERKFKGGGVLHLSELGFLSAQLNVYEKIGITPDRSVAETLAAIRTPADEDLIEAEKLVLKSEW